LQHNETECDPIEHHMVTSVSSPLTETERESLYAEISALRKERDALRKERDTLKENANLLVFITSLKMIQSVNF